MNVNKMVGELQDIINDMIMQKTIGHKQNDKSIDTLIEVKQHLANEVNQSTKLALPIQNIS